MPYMLFNCRIQRKGRDVEIIFNGENFEEQKIFTTHKAWRRDMDKIILAYVKANQGVLSQVEAGEGEGNVRH